MQPHGGGMLVPFGSINPKLPDWEEDVRRCHEQFRMPGIRVHPTYHDYTLMDPAFLRLLQVAAERALLVQIAAWMEDERCPNPLLRVPILNLDVLPGLLVRVPNVKVEILNAFLHVNMSNQLPQRVRQFHVAFDFATLDGVGGAREPDGGGRRRQCRLWFVLAFVLFRVRAAQGS